jgi:inosine/xanthosine triphosphatase
MKINVGSHNKVKIQGVINTFRQYKDKFPSVEIKGVDVNIEEFGHPEDMEQTMKGAINRAMQAFKNCDLSIGLESGFVKAPGSRTGNLEIGVAVIYDGKDIYTGLSSAFEWPEDVTKYILEGKGDGSQAFKEMGYTTLEKVGAENGGASGRLTNGRITREDTIVQSLIMALIALENPKYK